MTPHDVSDLRRGLRRLADDAPPFDPRAALAAEDASTDDGACGRAVQQPRRSAGRSRRIAPWLVGAAAAAALLVAVAPSLGAWRDEAGAGAAQTEASTSAPSDTGSTTGPSVGAGPRAEALLHGPAVLTAPGCLQVLQPTDDLVPVVLPPGYTVIETDAGHHLIGPDGTRLAVVGTPDHWGATLRLGGGYGGAVPTQCAGTWHRQPFTANTVEVEAP